MLQCTKCNARVSDEAKFCPNCGAGEFVAVGSNDTYGVAAQYSSGNYAPQYHNEVVGMGTYLGFWALALIPVVGWIVQIILGFIWGFSREGALSRKNFARAYLIWTAIMVGIGIVLFAIFATGIFTFFNSYVINQRMFF